MKPYSNNVKTTTIVKIYLGILSGICITCSGNIPVKAHQKLILMTYNIHHGAPENSATVNLAAIAAVIRKSKADIIALQEVDVNTLRSGNINQAEVLAQKLQMNCYFSKSINYEGGDYGVAILSKYPISHQRKYSLPMPQKGEKRSMALVNVQLPNGRKIKFGSTHFDLNIPNRIAQAEYLTLLNTSIKEPLFIGGDYNAESGSAEITLLQKSFNISCINQCPLSIPVRNPRRAIDYFAFNALAEKQFKLLSVETLKQEYASDHLPVVTTFKY